MTGPVAVRPAVPADLETVAALEAEALGADAWSRGLLAAGLAGDVPTVAYLAAVADTRLVGYAVLSLAGDVVELQRIAVGADHRRQGIATVLIGAARAFARDHDAERVLLEVRDDNAGARACYAAAGFTELARRPRYYDDGAAAVILELR